MSKLEKILLMSTTAFIRAFLWLEMEQMKIDLICW